MSKMKKRILLLVLAILLIPFMFDRTLVLQGGQAAVINIGDWYMPPPPPPHYLITPNWPVIIFQILLVSMYLLNKKAEVQDL